MVTWKKKFGSAKLQQIVRRRQRPRARPLPKVTDRVSLPAKPSAGDASRIGDRLGAALPQLPEGRLLIGEGGRLGPGEPRGAELRGVAGALHLAGERQHVGREPRLDEGYAIACSAACAPLVEQVESTVRPRVKTGTEASYIESGMALVLG